MIDWMHGRQSARIARREGTGFKVLRVKRHFTWGALSTCVCLLPALNSAPGFGGKVQGGKGRIGLWAYLRVKELRSARQVTS